MIPAALRPHLAWWQRTQTEPPSLPPSAVGGVPIEDFRPSQPTCPEPGCGLTDPDAETVLLHAFAEHGRDRRRKDRRAAA